MNTPQSPDAFTIERHGELTLISATPALESWQNAERGRLTRLSLLERVNNRPVPEVAAAAQQAAAQAAVERVFTRSSNDEMNDPWWTYHFFIIRNAAAIMQALQRPFTKNGATPAGGK